MKNINKEIEALHGVDRNPEGEVVLDLIFNNELGYGGVATSLHAVVTVIFSVLIMITAKIISVLIIDRSFIKAHKDYFEVAGYLVLVVAFVTLYQRSKIYIYKLYTLKRRFQNKDLIFTEEKLFINPFLIANDNEQSELKFVFGREKTLKSKEEYISLPWKDLIGVEIIHAGSHRQNRHFYHLKMPQKLIVLNRKSFGVQEKQFLELIRRYSKAKIVNNTNFQEPLKELSPKERMIAIVIILITLGVAKYLGWTK
jgi:hypothetical protein